MLLERENSFNIIVELHHILWLEIGPTWITPTLNINSSKSRLPYAFINLLWFLVGPNLEKFGVKIIFIDDQTN